MLSAPNEQPMASSSIIRVSNESASGNKKKNKVNEQDAENNAMKVPSTTINEFLVDDQSEL